MAEGKEDFPVDFQNQEDPRRLVLYSDESILVVNKPAGLLTVPDGYHRELPTIRSFLEPQWGRCWIVHRLDKDTSGVMVIARTPEAHRDLNRQFASREVHKVYHAICAGSPCEDEWQINFPLRVNGDRNHRTVVDPVQGKPALTVIRVLRRLACTCLVAAMPFTGYTHQIRAHLSSSGFPLLGDPLYRIPRTFTGPVPDFSSLPIFSRPALHAFQIHFLHPETGQSVEFTAPYPVDFQALLDQLS
ncbi:pseudouridine synthase, RluA family [Anaerolinea thermolimosa]|uniref:RluA family pseudouridine synthase n=1 Tax=Anaerolinea thermolimosa TaxID=229919 RepID=UPI0009FCEAE9|nr:RluA family pseudouridine synthase [Anaerolinea thermolimosa]GAP06675.1 pseudouridine synthase, RluA family [Anaerolinea thermolimosa]